MFIIGWRGMVFGVSGLLWYYYRTSELQSRTPPLIIYNIKRRGRIQFKILCVAAFFLYVLEKLWKAPHTWPLISLVEKRDPCIYDTSNMVAVFYWWVRVLLYYKIPWHNKRKQQHALCASARTLRVVTMVTVTRLVWLSSARTLRVVAMVVVARPARTMCGGGCGSARTMRAQREVQLTPCNNYYISAAPQILFI